MRDRKHEARVADPDDGRVVGVVAEEHARAHHGGRPDATRGAEAVRTSVRSACPTCPWRKTTPTGGFPGGVLDVVQLRDSILGGESAMQCHCSSDDSPLVCVGFALRVGDASSMFRVARALGRVDALDPDTRELLELPQLLERHAGVCGSRKWAEALRALADLRLRTVNT